jgi:polyisoprenoid-binding protein YceI
MKKLMTFAIAAFTFGTLSTSAQTTWSLDQVHSKLNFTVSHMSVSDCDGSFKAITCALTTPSAKDFNKASVTFTAETGSVNTDNDKRDEHIKSADFFDAANNPTITFKSTSVTKTTGNNF